jgi:photosystem II stability/assembly factor-like uncharacterized protein
MINFTKVYDIMTKSHISLKAIILPFLLVGTLQLSGCSSKELDPPPPGGAYFSTSGGAQFDQAVTLTDNTGTTIGDIAKYGLRKIHRSLTDSARTFVLASSGDILVTANEAETWQLMTKPIPAVSSLALLNNEILLIAGSDANKNGIVLRSLDKGKSWEKALTVPQPKEPESPLFEFVKQPDPAPVSVTNLALDPFHHDQMYATTNTGSILVGKQSGKVWYKTSYSGAPPQKIVPSPHREGELLVVTTEKRLIVLDVYQEKQELLVISKKRQVLDATYVNQFPDAIFIGTNFGAAITRDRGANWEELKLPLSTASPLTVSVVAVSPTNPSRLLVGVNHVVFRSEDGGETWNSLPLTTIPNHLITDISINPDNAARVLLITTPAKT